MCQAQKITKNPKSIFHIFRRVFFPQIISQKMGQLLKNQCFPVVVYNVFLRFIAAGWLGAFGWCCSRLFGRDFEGWLSRDFDGVCESFDRGV